jgi:hypothetical protein
MDLVDVERRRAVLDPAGGLLDEKHVVFIDRGFFRDQECTGETRNTIATSTSDVVRPTGVSMRRGADPA